MWMVLNDVEVLLRVLCLRKMLIFIGVLSLFEDEGVVDVVFVVMFVVILYVDKMFFVMDVMKIVLNCLWSIMVVMFL